MPLRKLTEQPDQAYMDSCVGEYYCDDAQSHFEVACRDGKLWMQHLRHPTYPMHYMGGDNFTYDGYKVRFVRDEQGHVTGYLFNSPHLRDIPFTKVK